MATLLRRSGKTPGYEIQFYDRGSRRTTIYLGGRRYSEKTAVELKDIVETLIYYRDNNISNPDKWIIQWIQNTTSDIRDKLVAVGLISVPTSHTAEELWEAFGKVKTGIKEATVKTYEDTHRRFFQFFRPHDELSELTPEQMKQWKDFLRTKAPRVRTKKTGLAESTVAGTISKAKAVFNWAVSAGWVEKSPLDGVGRGSFINRENDRFVKLDEYRRILEACPCLDWRVIITLARIGGLRCPSELLRLRWTDINWERNRFYVTSSKTDRYAGKEGRLVPLFPELRQELERLFFDQAEGTEFVINRYRNSKTNLGTQFVRIVKMAGVEEIKRPFDNMRASRSNEIYAAFGAFYESVWIGHSSKVAKDHYLQVREEDYERAVRDWTNPPAVGEIPKREFPCCPDGFSLLSENAFPAEIPATGGSIKSH